MSFWKELKRRNVYKVGIAYLIVAWLIVQAAAIVFPHLNLPSWAVTLVIVLLIIGFPLILLFAWAFEITPDGLKLTKDVPHHESITHLTGQKLNYILAGLLVIAVGYILVDKLYIEQRAGKNEDLSLSVEGKTKKTIAVLPFEDLSPESDQRYFVDGLSEEILNSLCQIPDLGVAGRTSSFSFKDSNKTIQEIASLLGVENILEGSVRKAGNALRITAQLVHASDGLHLWSKTYDRELKDIFEVQEDIATAVADELKATLGIEGARKILGGTDNSEAYELYLIAQGQYRDTKAELALKSLDSALALDPEFALAWALKASIHDSITTEVPSDRVAVELDAELSAAQRAIELEPNLAEAYAALGGYSGVSGDWIGAELAYRKALELGSKSSLEVGHYSNFLISVGYLKRYNEFLEDILRNDPLNHLTRAFYVASFGYLGDMKRAEEEYKRGRMLFGDTWMWGDMVISPLRLTSGNIVSRDEILAIPMLNPIWDMAREHLESPEEGLVELHRLYTDEENLGISSLTVISLFAAYFGDHELSMDATEKVVKLNAFSIHMIWTTREVRQLPRFKEFVREIGLVDYWNEFGWPDICHQLDNGDFECD